MLYLRQEDIEPTGSDRHNILVEITVKTDITGKFRSISSAIIFFLKAVFVNSDKKVQVEFGNH